MTKIRKSTLLAAVSLFIGTLALNNQVAAHPSWQKINAPQHATVKVNDEQRIIHPGCAFEGDDYSFYFKRGKLDKLAIFFNDGGACWDPNTCLASLQSGATPAYVPTDDIAHNDPNQQQGIFDFNNPDNPYKDWNVLFLPYCTGDVHLGSKEMHYPTGPTTTQTIRHHGFDNFLYAREWLKHKYAGKRPPRKVFVSGASAGAYGAVFNYPYIREIFPRSHAALLADSGSGVFTDSMLHTGISGENSAWNIDTNLAPWVPGMTSVTSQDVASFMPAAYGALSSYYPGDKFSQYSTVYDVVQVMFYNIMLNTDDPAKWTDPAVLGPLFGQWTTQMLTSSYLQSAAPNYRFYIAPGCKHTILRSNDVYSSQEVGGITFKQWLEGLTGGYRKAAQWSNLSCTDAGCLQAFPSAAELAACIATP